MNKTHLIYLIEGPTGKFYVGRTCNFKTRMGVHENMNDDCRKLNRAIEKYGWENFDISVIEDDLTFEEAKIREEFFISMIDSVKYGYNILRGGEGFGSGEDCVNFGRKHTDEHREKNRLAKTGINNPNFGKPRNKEVRDKISKSQPTSKSIIAIHLETGQETFFETISKASKSLKIHSGRICSVLNKKEGRTKAQGYTFKHVV